MAEDYFDDDEIKYRRSTLDMTPDEYLEDRFSYKLPEERGQAFGPRPKIVEIPSRGPAPLDPTYAKEADIRMKDEGLYRNPPYGGPIDKTGMEEEMGRVPEGSWIEAGGKRFEGKAKKEPAAAVDFSNFDKAKFLTAARGNLEKKFGVSFDESSYETVDRLFPNAAPEEKKLKKAEIDHRKGEAYKELSGVTSLIDEKLTEERKRASDIEKGQESARSDVMKYMNNKKSAEMALYQIEKGESDIDLSDVGGKGLTGESAKKYLSDYIKENDREINRLKNKYKLGPIAIGDTMFQTHKPFEEPTKFGKATSEAGVTRRPSGDIQNLPKPTKAGESLTDNEIAKAYLTAAGGDKNKARELAKQVGWIL